MAKNVSKKKTNYANNRPNCLKVTKNPQKVNLQQVKIKTESGKVEKVIDWDEFLIFIQENEIFGRIDYKQSVKFMVCSYPAYLISNLITYRGVARCESQDPVDDWNFFRNIKSKIVTPSSAVKSGAVVRFIEFDKLGWGGDKTFKAEYAGELI